MNKYRFFNNLTGWLVFLVATVVYLLTIEPTASFWDCGEFISSAYKQQVGHPPGAPFFMLMGRFFTLFAGGNKELVAITINAMSALASSFTILFLFWTITHLVKKIVVKTEGDHSIFNLLVILGSGIVGALAYTFSDTFWFSAVEGEVYASSSLFTAIVFWAILKWEDSAAEPHANRWLILIAFLMGLSIGVHLLNLLAIPAIVFVYYFKNYTVSRKGIIIAAIVAVLVLGMVMYGVIQGAVLLASWFELFFVNGIGLPFNTGVFIYFTLLVTGLSYGIWYTYKKELVLWNTILTTVAVLLIGYSSYTIIVIRSKARPPMNQNSPDNLFSLLYYLNREQYGDRPLLYGQNYNSPAIDLESTSNIYSPNAETGKYEVVNKKQAYKYEDRFLTVFPRMYSSESHHIKAYESWVDIKGKKITHTQNDGQTVTIKSPTLADNLSFFFRYQIGYMYLRYFMWNFAGRQNDIQGSGELNKGNWICGIAAIDDARLGSQEMLPDYMKNNKARNRYYLLPLLLGFAGLFYQYKKSKRDFTVVILLFILTGLAIVVYLNQTPYQPRERDYAYAGSFYAFTIWIGLGVAALIEWISRKKKQVVIAAGVTAGCLFLVPVTMAMENWDDHDRSGRYTARDFAYNYLHSCEENAIIFTNGDNDTFPLWYAQEVEDIRTDVRVVNLSYLSADWYIAQKQQKAYKSEPIASSFSNKEFMQGKNDVVFLIDKSKDFIPLNQAIQFIKRDDDAKMSAMGDRNSNYLPTKRFSLPINREVVLNTQTVRPEMQDKIVDEMRWEINRQYITKSDLMVLDYLNSNQWKRPIYFAVTVSRENYQGLENYFQNCGLAYRIVPIQNFTRGLSSGGVDTKKMYDNMMNKFRWGIDTTKEVYLDENNIRMFSNMRIYFADLASSLIAEGQFDKAKEVLHRCIHVIPSNSVPHNYFSLPLAENLFKVGDTIAAVKLVNEVADLVEQDIRYLTKIPRSYYSSSQVRKKIGYDAIYGDRKQGEQKQGDIHLNLYIANELIKLTQFYQQKEMSEKLLLRFQPYLSGNQMQ